MTEQDNNVVTRTEVDAIPTDSSVDSSLMDDELIIDKIETRKFLLSRGYTDEEINQRIRWYASGNMDEDHTLAFLKFRELNKDL